MIVERQESYDVTSTTVERQEDEHGAKLLDDICSAAIFLARCPKAARTDADRIDLKNALKFQRPKVKWKRAQLAADLETSVALANISCADSLVGR